MQDSLRRFQFLWDITYLCWNLTTMGYEITPQGPAASQLRVFIDYALPSRGLSRLLGVAAWPTLCALVYEADGEGRDRAV